MKKLLFLPVFFLSFCHTIPSGLPQGDGTIDSSLFPKPVAIYKKRNFRPLIIESNNIAVVDLIIQFEGFRARTYICSGGKKTIGYGFTDPKYTNQNFLSENKAREILIQELIPRYESAVERHVKKELTPNQKTALISFCFNLGEGALAKVAERINKGDHEAASEAMMRYTKARNKRGELVVLDGLVERRKREVEVFNS